MTRVNVSFLLLRPPAAALIPNKVDDAMGLLVRSKLVK